jgi:hypothetical protein
MARTMSTARVSTTRSGRPIGQRNGLHPSKTQAFLGPAHVTTTMTHYTAITDVAEATELLRDLTSTDHRHS